jgi:hypothetical protein
VDDFWEQFEDLIAVRTRALPEELSMGYRSDDQSGNLQFGPVPIAPE